MGMQYTTFSDTSNYHVVAHISHYISALYPPSMAIVSLFFHPMNIAGYQTAFPWDHFFLVHPLWTPKECYLYIPWYTDGISEYTPLYPYSCCLNHHSSWATSHDIFSFIHPVWDVLGAVIPERRRMPFLFLRRNTKPFQSVTWSWNVYLGDVDHFESWPWFVWK